MLVLDVLSWTAGVEPGLGGVWWRLCWVSFHGHREWTDTFPLQTSE